MNVSKTFAFIFIGLSAFGSAAAMLLLDRFLLNLPGTALAVVVSGAVLLTVLVYALLWPRLKYNFRALAISLRISLFFSIAFLLALLCAYVSYLAHRYFAEHMRIYYKYYVNYIDALYVLFFLIVMVVGVVLAGILGNTIIERYRVKSRPERSQAFPETGNVT